MQALILIIPLLVCYWDQCPKKQHKHIVPPPIMRTLELPPHTESIYFVVGEGL